jgi:hypothetical protein
MRTVAGIDSDESPVTIDRGSSVTRTQLEAQVEELERMLTPQDPSHILRDRHVLIG